MSKEALIEKVKGFIETADDMQLSELEHFVDENAAQGEDEWNALPKAFRERMLTGIAAGRKAWTPHEEVMNDLKEWKTKYSGEK